MLPSARGLVREEIGITGGRVSLRCERRRTDLRLVGELEREPGDGERRLVDEGVVDALVAEESREDAPVGGESGERDPGVLSDAEHLPLVGGELGGGLVDGGEDGVGAGAEPDAGGALLDGLHGVLHLEQPPLGAPCGHVGVVLVAEHPRRSPSSSSVNLLDSTIPECAGGRASVGRVWGSLASRVRFWWQRGPSSSSSPRWDLGKKRKGWGPRGSGRKKRLCGWETGFFSSSEKGLCLYGPFEPLEFDWA